MPEQSKGVIPVPDPLGLLSKLTSGFFYDPWAISREIRDQVEKVPEVSESMRTGQKPIGTDIEKYIHHLTQAHQLAPCPGCKKLVENALVGVKIYQKMQETGKSAPDIKKSDLERITKEVLEEVKNG
jgi:hypothetical protein